MPDWIIGIGALILIIGIPYSFVIMMLMIWNKEDINDRR
tara:strand:- start:9035 stop:9151 length:117 start_codon:yes stop_codon:yes gene_type:complete